MIRLLIVDDHDVVRMGLKQVFSGRVDMEVAGEARTGEEAISYHKGRLLRPSQ